MQRALIFTCSKRCIENLRTKIPKKRANHLVIYLEQHWNGSLLDTKDAVIRFAQTMKWNGKNPIVNLVEKCYQTGVSLTQKAMAQIEKRLERLEGLEKWFAKISSITTKTVE